MAIAWWQILLLTMLAFWMIIDQITVGILTNYPLLYGFVSGIIMGDVKTGLVVGATLQLMVLGVGTYGGASMPDFMTGASLEQPMPSSQEKVSTSPLASRCQLVY